MVNYLSGLVCRGLVDAVSRLILLLTGSYLSTLWSLVGVVSSRARAASCRAAISCSASNPTFPISSLPPLGAELPTTYLELSLANFSCSSCLLEGLLSSFDVVVPRFVGLEVGSMLRSRLELTFPLSCNNNIFVLIKN